MALAGNALAGSGPQQSNPASGRFKLDTTVPLSQFNSPGGQAYEASDLNDPSRSIYALVHSAGLPYRSEIYDALMLEAVPNLVAPITQEVMDLGLDTGSKQCLVTFFERPLGAMVLSSSDSNILTEKFIKGPVVKTLVQTIATLHARGFTHRAIRPQNLFFVDAEGSDEGRLPAAR